MSQMYDYLPSNISINFLDETCLEGTTLGPSCLFGIDRCSANTGSGFYSKSTHLVGFLVLAHWNKSMVLYHFEFRFELGPFHLNIPGRGGTPLISDPPTTNRKKPPPNIKKNMVSPHNQQKNKKIVFPPPR